MQDNDTAGRILSLHGQSTFSKTLVVTPSSSCARWLERDMAGRQPLVGIGVMGMEIFLSSAARLIAGPPLPFHDLISLTREILRGRDTFSKAADAPGYARIVLGLFTQLDRAAQAGMDLQKEIDSCEGKTRRDSDLVAAFLDFKRLLERHMEKTGESSWYDGTSPWLIERHAESVPFLKSSSQRIVAGFPQITSWQERLFNKLGFKLLKPCRTQKNTRAIHLQCAGPEAEIAAVTRILRRERSQTTVFVPADEVGYWVQRLGHRDVPVMTWVSRPIGMTAVARTVKALFRICNEERPTRVDLETVLFGRALHPWAASGGQEKQRTVLFEEIKDAWQSLRRESASLPGWLSLAQTGEDKSIRNIERDAARSGRDQEKTKVKKQVTRDAFSALRAGIERLRSVNDAHSLSSLLREWKLAGIARAHSEHGPEPAAASLVIECLAGAGDLSLADLAELVIEEIDGTGSGEWVDETTNEDSGSVKVVPYEAAIDALPERAILTGLERFPAPPKPSPLLSEAALQSLGMQTENSRYDEQRKLLDQLSSSPGLVVSWRSQDGQGGACAPGPWVARRREEPYLVGLREIALPVEGNACSPIEKEILAPRSNRVLSSRMDAIRSHEAPQVGTHTGNLGVRIEAEGERYSVSSLQFYAYLPYVYFVERVLGIEEPERPGDEPDALEQGSAVHTALEKAVSRLIRERDGPALVGDNESREKLWAGIQDELARVLSEEFKGLLADAVLSGHIARWSQELAAWWKGWNQRHTPESDKVSDFYLAATEFGFGSRNDPLKVNLPDSVQLPLSGWIDLVEWHKARGRLEIVDYKTGRSKPSSILVREIRAGAHLQLPMYALAVEQEPDKIRESLRLPGDSPLPEVEAVRLEYLKRSHGGNVQPTRVDLQTPLSVNPETGKPMTAVQTAAWFSSRFVQEIRAGRFPLVERLERLGRGPQRMDEVLRVVPTYGSRPTPGLTEALEEFVPEEATDVQDGEEAS